MLMELKILNLIEIESEKSNQDENSQSFSEN